MGIFILTFVPTRANLFPGANVEQRAYLEAMVDTHCWVDLHQSEQSWMEQMSDRTYRMSLPH